MTYFERIFDATTGEVTEVPYTAEQLAEVEAAQAAAQEHADKAAADKAARDAAIAHAKGLGFTDAMIAVMYPNLVEA